MKRFAFGILFALSLAVAPACGGDDDDDGGDATDCDGADAAADGPDAAADEADAAAGGEAEAFCTGYGVVCEFGEPGYADQEACVTAFEGYDGARQTCVSDHLVLAEAEEDGSADEMMHCSHAAGNVPCN
jgi:hypothetical protein